MINMFLPDKICQHIQPDAPRCTKFYIKYSIAPTMIAMKMLQIYTNRQYVEGNRERDAKNAVSIYYQTVLFLLSFK